MVVQVVRPDIRRAHADRAVEPPPVETPEHPVLELVGGAQRLRRSTPPSNAPLLSPDETLRALRLLAVDSLVDIVHLRETVSLQDSRIRSLERELSVWRDRAMAEVEQRRLEGIAAHRRERDLISVVHHQMLTTQAMSEEVERGRRRRWRRHRRVTVG